MGLWGTFAFSALAVIGVLVQVYLIGGFLFGESGWLDTHRDMGKLVHLFYVLTFVSALVAAWPEWRKTGWPFALAALGTVQAFLAGGSGFEKGQDGALHAFHAALVPIVFVIAFMIAWRALLREKRLTAKNMETLPGQLMTAVMLVSMTADSNAERVAEAALSRMEFYEREGRGEFPLAH